MACEQHQDNPNHNVRENLHLPQKRTQTRARILVHDALWPIYPEAQKCLRSGVSDIVFQLLYAES